MGMENMMAKIMGWSDLCIVNNVKYDDCPETYRNEMIDYLQEGEMPRNIIFHIIVNYEFWRDHPTAPEREKKLARFCATLPHVTVGKHAKRWLEIGGDVGANVIDGKYREAREA
jgi:hypothetical protein